MKITVKESFKIPGTDTIVEAGQELEIIESQETYLKVDEKEVDHDNRTVTMTNDEWKKVHKDYRGKIDGKDTALVMGPKGTTSYKVIIKERVEAEVISYEEFVDNIKASKSQGAEIVAGIGSLGGNTIVLESRDRTVGHVHDNGSALIMRLTDRKGDQIMLPKSDIMKVELLDDPMVNGKTFTIYSEGYDRVCSLHVTEY